MEINFRINNGKSIEQINADRVCELARFYGLDRLAPNRYSSLFVLDLYVLDRFNGVSPEQVIGEIKYLEGFGPALQTKEATEFKRSVLKGLWHKHFLPSLPSSFAHNIINHLGKNGLENLVNEIFDPNKSAVVTRQMIEELTHRLVEGSITDRGAAGKLTGEWIIFAKENHQNYYLSVASHARGDKIIASNLSVCMAEFPFLEKYLASR